MNPCSYPNAYPNVYPDDHREIDHATIRLITLDPLLFRLRKDFYNLTLKEKGFLNIPILGTIYDVQSHLF